MTAINIACRLADWQHWERLYRRAVRGFTDDDDARLRVTEAAWYPNVDSHLAAHQKPLILIRLSDYSRGPPMEMFHVREIIPSVWYAMVIQRWTRRVASQRSCFLPVAALRLQSMLLPNLFFLFRDSEKNMQNILLVY